MTAETLKRRYFTWIWIVRVGSDSGLCVVCYFLDGKPAK